MNGNTKLRFQCTNRSLAAALSIAAAAGFAALAGIAGAAVVTGSMAYRDGKPADRRELHFENRVTSDMYVARTKSDGTFAADLPFGSYDLRAERGVILKYQIKVGAEDQAVGQVVEPAPLDFHRPFQHEGIADAILDFAAPSAANVTGRAIEGMRHGHEAIAAMGAPANTPVPKETPLSEQIPSAAPSPSGMK